MLIGRKEGAGLRIPDAGVSREHCELVTDEDSVTVRDLNSSNGTYVNATRVKEAELAPGDLLAVGSNVFAVRIDGFPKIIDAASAYLEGTPPSPTPVPVAPSPNTPPKASKPAPPMPVLDDNDDSSVVGFDFLDDEDDDQPKL
jgi:pSer/pThr/pTyr-binding forkhead associated (FHA) protein